MANTTNSLVINFPSLPEIKGELETCKRERLALYDIIMKAFMYKYNYEMAREVGKQALCADQNLKDIKVYGKFLNEINDSIRDPFLRTYVIDTIKKLKNNDFSKDTVKKTYKTVYDWFVPTSTTGKIFRGNLATGTSYASINFESIFRLCNTQAITEDCALFEDVKNIYHKYVKDYEDLLK